MRSSPDDLEHILRELGKGQWANPDCFEEDASTGAISKETLALCRRFAGALREASTAEEALADLEALSSFGGLLLSKRLEEIISVESRCILVNGQVAADQALPVVAEILSSLLHLRQRVSDTAGTACLDAVSVGYNILPNMLECIMVGVTQCWQCDWKALSPQLQPIRDLVLRRPMLDQAAFCLLRLVWQRAPSLLLDDRPADVTPQCAYALASLSQEIHDALVSHRLACAHNAELILMTDLRRVVLDFLGQVGNRQAQSEKPRAAPAPATPPRKKKRELEEMESEPRPSRSKISHEPNMAKDTASPASIPNTPEQGFELKERTLEEATEQVWKVKPVDAVDTLVDMLVKDYGSLELATSLADRAERAIDTMAWAVSKSLTPEASEAKEAVEAMQKVADFMKYLQMLLEMDCQCQSAVAWQMPRFVKRLTDSGPWESSWRHGLSKVLELVIHPTMAQHSATALWAQVVGDCSRKSCPKRMMAVGALARELDLILGDSDQDTTKLQACMQQLCKSANDCLKHAGSDDEEAKPSGSHARCDSESEEIPSEDTLSPLSEEDEDFGDWEDTRPESNTLGFLKMDGQKFYCASDTCPTEFQRHISNLKNDWKERLQKLFDTLPDDEALPTDAEKKMVAEEDMPKGSSWRS